MGTISLASHTIILLFKCRNGVESCSVVLPVPCAPDHVIPFDVWAYQLAGSLVFKAAVLSLLRCLCTYKIQLVLTQGTIILVCAWGRWWVVLQAVAASASLTFAGHINAG